jgi:UDPglucose 6-dehydrogenase
MSAVKTIGVVGGGVVGHATARCFMEWAEVRVWDIKPERKTHSLDDTTRGCDIVFICLPETEVVRFFEPLVGLVHEGFNWVIKSTVPIGTTQQIADMGFKSVVHSPEFLTARCAVTDAQVPARNVIGVPEHYQTSGYTTLRRLYERRFPGVPVHPMHSDESEALKLIQNSFFAVKVAFWNEARELCDKLGLDWNAVRDGVLSDGRIAHSHTQVPGPDGKFGFGGACLPKDLAHLVSACREAGLWPAVSLAAAARNMTDRGRGNDE